MYKNKFQENQTGIRDVVQKHQRVFNPPLCLSKYVLTEGLIIPFNSDQFT